MMQMTGEERHTASRSRRGGAGRLAAAVLGAAGLTVGLVAGTFFAFAISVMPALAEVDDEKFVEVMNKINSSIQNNQAFLLSFTGAIVLSGAAAIMHHRMGARAAVRWILASLALYLVAFVLTMGVSVPLNNALAGVDLSSPAAVAAGRADFEDKWTTFNLVRTIASTLALGCLGAALATRRDKRER